MILHSTHQTPSFTQMFAHIQEGNNPAAMRAGGVFTHNTDKFSIKSSASEAGHWHPKVLVLITSFSFLYKLSKKKCVTAQKPRQPAWLLVSWLHRSVFLPVYYMCKRGYVREKEGSHEAHQ